MIAAAETRRRLPNRRGHELLSFEHGGIYYTAGFGRFENGDLAEIFLTTAKHGTAVDVNARDAGRRSLAPAPARVSSGYFAQSVDAEQRRFGFGTAGACP
jgi:hypothetical protein